MSIAIKHDWRRCVDEPAPEGVMVNTKIDDTKGCRNEQTMCRFGRLWFMDEKQSMYVYYTPTHWAPLPAPTGDGI